MATAYYRVKMFSLLTIYFHTSLQEISSQSKHIRQHLNYLMCCYLLAQMEELSHVLLFAHQNG